jgi:anionic cell wall polymer biosynthesis LytR-Cps2A-Psr (LCP) family protein
LSSAFKNFCITFGAGLLVFGLIGWLLIYPALEKIPDGTTESSSEDVSDYSNAPTDTSGTESGEPVVVGRTFTAVFIGKASDGVVASVVYMRANEKKQTFSYCFIPTDTLASNNIGTNEPIKYLLSKVNGETALKKLSSLVGVDIDYYAVLGVDELAAVADKFANAKFNIPNEIKYPDPNAPEVPEENPEENPEDPSNEVSRPEIVVPAGDNKLNGDLVRKIMGYNPTNGEEYHVLTKQLYESVFTQFLTDPGTKKNKSAIVSLLAVVTNTNLNAVNVEENIDLIFTFDSFKKNEIKFSSGTDWTKISPLFRD